MKLTYLSQWLGDQEITAICWTLIHSLWIGLIIAVLAGIIIACTRKATANLRYRLFCGLLVLFIVSVICVALYQFAENSPVLTSNVPLVSLANQASVENNPVANPSSSFLNTTVAFLNQNAVWIFALWLICFLYKSMKLVVGIFYIRRIRTYKVQELDEEWTAKVQEFSFRMGIKKQVSIIESVLVKVPVTLGYLKPLIVLPIGLLVQLPAAQVETILWHELAHIYRRDYAVNILQKIIEAVFFFNPAILWLSALIREEREACCDDIVLANVLQKGNYLEALVAFHNQEHSVGGLAMGLSLRPNQLINRLRRMVHKENKRLSFVELVVLFAGLLLFSAFTFIPQVKPGIKNSVVYIKQAISESLNTTTTPKHKPVAKPSAFIGTAMQNKQDTTSADTLMKFKSIRFKNSNEDKANREVNFIDGKDNRYHVIVVNGKLTLVEFNEQVVAASEFKKYENILEQIDNLIKQKLKNPSAQYSKNFIVSTKEWNVKPKDGKFSLKEPFPDSLKWEKLKGAKIKQWNISKDSSAYFQKPKKKMPVVDASADKARVFGVIDFLVQNKVVSNASLVSWFALTDDQLVVNDQKQSSQLHQQLKEKYHIKPKYGLFFGPSKVHGVGIFFDKNDL